MAKKYYAIRRGRKPGIYDNWPQAKEQVEGFKGAEYKGFESLDEAKSFMDAGRVSKDAKKSGEQKLTLPYAFVDGSYNVKTTVYGCGGYLYDNDGVRHLIQASGEDETLKKMRNVAGEILGARLAVEKALELGLGELTIYYDYEGIRSWALKEWKRNEEGTIAYAEFIDGIKDKIKLNFVHVKAHTGIPGNEEADALAKEAVGIQ